MNGQFEYMTSLQYKVKNLSDQVSAFKSGDMYITMQSGFKQQLSEKDRKIKKLEKELATAHKAIITVRNNWFQVFEDMQKQHAEELLKKNRAIKALEEKVLKTERAHDETKDKLTKKTRAIYQVKTELEEERGINLKLRAQINRDYENSAIPSSQKPNHKKIANSREKTGKKQGGQPGHEGHPRKKQTPTSRIQIPAPEEYSDSPEYKPTGHTITKQVVNLEINLRVDEYETPEFRNIRTGQRVHADFPEGVINEVNYGGSIKALSFLLNNHCCVSVGKVRDFISEITNGELQISTGMINGLSKEFSQKTKQEQKEAFNDLLISPVMNFDFTSVRMNGKKVQVAVCATPNRIMYIAREAKGHNGVKGTPLEDYQGTAVHDHDTTFYSYGSAHQECLAHILRYLKDSMENEPGLKWNKQMRELIQEMIHHRNSLEPDTAIDLNTVEKYETRYVEVLKTAKEEYEYVPPSDYYREGYNLYQRMDKYKDSHLLFLHDPRVPPTNNLAEQKLRVLVRKGKQVMTFRSTDSIAYLCNGMGMIDLLCTQGKNLYKKVASIFN